MASVNIEKSLRAKYRLLCLQCTVFNAVVTSYPLCTFWATVLSTHTDKQRCCKIESSNMSTSACDHCARSVKEEDSITCMAFCDKVFHLKCTATPTTPTKLNKPFVKIVQECSNLLWMCDDCAKLMKMMKFKSAVSSLGDAISEITAKQESMHTEIKKQLAKQGQQIALLSKRINPLTPTREAGNFFRQTPTQPPSKRRRDDEAATNQQLLGGTKAVTDSSVVTVPEPVELLWIYLSRIHPSVERDAAEKMVNDCLPSVDSVKVIPLIRQGADTSRLSFISYKVGVDPKFRESALNTDTWPKGILFREFEDRSAKNLWLPRPNTPTIVASDEVFLSPASIPAPAMDLTC